MLKILKKIKCKIFVCCGSKCSLNDQDKDGIPDELKIEKTKEKGLRIAMDEKCDQKNYGSDNYFSDVNLK